MRAACSNRRGAPLLSADFTPVRNGKKGRSGRLSTGDLLFGNDGLAATPQQNMSQIFHPSTNTISRLSIFGGIALLVALVSALAVINESPYFTEVGVARTQPVPYFTEVRVARPQP